MIKKDYSIVIIRIMATFFILGCHVASFLGLNFIGQFLNVGVQIFLVISGYLYGKRKEKFGFKWLYNRYIRLFIPIIIFVTFVCAYYNFMDNSCEYLHIFTYALGLMGIDGLQGYFYFYKFIGTEHLWFITVLFVCYILLMLISRIQKKLQIKVVNAILLIFLIVSLLTPYIKIYISLIFIFFVGYCFSKYYEERFAMKHYIIVSSLMIFGIIIRLLAKSFFDDTMFYERIVTSLSQNIVGFWFFISIKIFYRYKPALIDKITNLKIIIHIDALSYYIYIVHYVFFVGPFVLTSYLGSAFLAAIVSVILSFLLAEILMFISNIFIRRLRT